MPPASEGGADKLDVIEGRVTGGKPGQQLVLYAKNGKWWVQPLANEPFTRLNPDWSWTNGTHVGTDYAALLVEPGYQPPVTLDAIPGPGNSVVAITVAKGGSLGASLTRALNFSGYEWRIRNAPSDRGGQNNYDPNNAWTDASGALHLRIAKVGDGWACAEVTLTRSFGYGTYAFTVEDLAHLEPAAVFTMFTWDYAGTDPNHREMDMEFSRWGDPTNKSMQYVVQPFYVAENASRFILPAGTFTHSFHWEAGRVTFRSVPGAGDNPNAQAAAEHVFTSGIPTPGIESARMSLHIFTGSREPLQKGVEVVVKKFQYLP